MASPNSRNASRPSFLWLSCFVAINVAAAGLAEGLRLIPGVSIVFWPPSGIFVAALLLNDRTSWHWWIAGACAAELAANALWFHNPFPLALWYFAGNAVEALTATLLVKRFVVGATRTIDPNRLESPRNAALFVILAGAVAPAVGATILAATDALLGKHPFGTVWLLVWLGDGTGLLFSAPLTLAAAQVWRHRRRVSSRRVLEFLVTCALTVMIAWLALRGDLSTVYTTLPAIVWMAVRFQLLGAWVGLAAIILTVAAFTRSGRGEFSGAPDQMQARIVALQVYLAVCASSALVVAGLSRRHLRALERLRTANRLLERRIDHRTAALRVAGESFRSLVEQSPFGVYAVDADFRLVMVSAGAHKVFQNVRPLLGRDFEEVLRILWSEPFVSDSLQHFRHTLVTGVPYHAPSTVEQRLDSGETEAYDWKIERVALPDGRPGVVCHFYDLSERQRYEEALRASEQRYRTLVDATSVVTWICPASSDSDDVSQMPWERWTSPTTQHMLGNPWADAVHPEDAASAAARWNQAVALGEPFTNEQRIRRYDGQWRWMRVYAAPVRQANGVVAEWFGMCQDITEVKEAEEKLREADRRKDEFLATLAHELRNPLAPIRSGLEVMRISAEDPAIVAEMRDTMTRQVSHLVALVDDLLDVSRISQGKLSLRMTQVKLSDVIHDAIALCRPVVDDADHCLHLEQPTREIELYGDFHRFVQILSNLINNAAKYTPPGGNIWVTATIEDSDAVIAVRDDGIGISDEYLHEVFAMFAQIAKPDSMYRGLGIGLSLVKSLVQMHGGSVEVTSAGTGKGATFVVRLPIAKESTQPKRTPAEHAISPPLRRGHRVLVVDDNYAASRSLSLIIQQLGNEVRTAENGSVAITVAREFCPDLVIMDIGMPVMDGNAAARAIRAQPWGQAMILVALTGWGQNEDIQETKDAGFDDHLVKPIEAESIQRLLRDLDAHLDAKRSLNPPS